VIESETSTKLLLLKLYACKQIVTEYRYRKIFIDIDMNKNKIRERFRYAQCMNKIKWRIIKNCRAIQ